MRIEEKIGSYLNEEREFQAFELERREKTGLVAKIARSIAKVSNSSKMIYKVVEDRQPIGIFAGNSEEDAIKKAKKIIK